MKTYRAVIRTECTVLYYVDAPDEQTAVRLLEEEEWDPAEIKLDPLADTVLVSIEFDEEVTAGAARDAAEDAELLARQRRERLRSVDEP